MLSTHNVRYCYWRCLNPNIDWRLILMFVGSLMLLVGSSTFFSLVLFSIFCLLILNYHLWSLIISPFYCEFKSYCVLVIFFFSVLIGIIVVKFMITSYTNDKKQFFKTCIKILISSVSDANEQQNIIRSLLLMCVVLCMFVYYMLAEPGSK